MTHFFGSVEVRGLAGASSPCFHPAGRCLPRLLCLEKKDLGTEAESWKELDCGMCGARGPSAEGAWYTWAG